MTDQGRKRATPNILVTGTPGTGKTSTCSLLASATGLRHINVGELVKEKSLHDGWDAELDCYVVNDDLLCDEMEDMMRDGGNLVDYHNCDFFPERWFDYVVVLQTDNSVLYDRLTNRGYMGRKLQNNMECEIFQVLLEDAHEFYNVDIVRALPSNTIEDMSNNVEILSGLIRAWGNNT
ncbi:unnamed protein product [Sphagnum troendelagicum]|uniref:Adenylate kinase isoenzyme 6 homolog n=1 Tax=Sphagnum troendelagicum TaxID=128251 RepID=A0ABP0U5Y8_9BRYO